jgi:hypothetical protein
MDVEDEVHDEHGDKLAMPAWGGRKALCPAVAGTPGSGDPASIFARRDIGLIVGSDHGAPSRRRSVRYSFVRPCSGADLGRI